MGDYKDNMSEEKKPASILPEGLRTVRVTEMIKGLSKAGNNQFVTTIEDTQTRESMQVWLVSEPKKRWMLKSLLAAVKAPASEDGVYDWSTTDVIGKKVIANIKHYKEPWINREGNEVMLDKCKVSEFLMSDEQENTIDADKIAWDE